VFYTAIKHDGHLRTQKKCSKHEPQASVLYFFELKIEQPESEELLDEGNWEPEQIAAKLPTFLQFLRQVQRNVAPQAMLGGE